MRTSILAATTALSFVFVAAAFAADAPKPGLVRGTIASFDGKTLAMTTADGAVTGAFTQSTRVFTVEPRKLDQLTSKDFVGITSVDGANGHLKAEEIHILPGVVGEGQYPWDHHPGGGAMRAGSMTNGMVSTGDSGHLTVTFHGSEMVNGKCVGHAAPGGTGCTGTAIVDVPPETPIVALVPGTPADIKPGLTAVGGAGTVNGAVVFGSLTVEKNGVKPEF